MNENPEDITKRLTDRINRIFNQLRAKYPVASEPAKIPPLKPKPVQSVKELGLKPEIVTFSDKRLNDALAVLKAYGYDEKAVIRFLNGLELNSGSSVNSVIKMGLENL